MFCNASYVGQMERLLTIRILEHRNHINKRTNQHSIYINLNLIIILNIKILDEEKNYNKRLILESTYIKKQKNSLNLQEDNEMFFILLFILRRMIFPS